MKTFMGFVIAMKLVTTGLLCRARLLAGGRERISFWVVVDVFRSRKESWSPVQVRELWRCREKEGSSEMVLGSGEEGLVRLKLSSE